MSKNTTNYEWSQTTESITIKLPVKHISLKKTDIFFSDLYLKINIPDIKYFADFNLLHEIDYTDKNNRTLMTETYLEVHLIKKEPALWDSLVYVSSDKEELRKRRDDSIARLRSYEEEEKKKFFDTKHQMDKNSVNELMRIENEQRKEIKKKKAEEKERAEQEIYDTLNKLEERDEELKQQSYASDIPMKKDNAQIFDDTQLPQVRGKQSHQVQFTEKKFPHMPARESHQKEAPYPKSKKLKSTKEEFGIDIEDRDPVWMKDKGDHFFLNHDFLSAINAYNRAIELDNEFIKCYINRATCYLRIRGYGKCIEDCDKSEILINNLPESDKDDEFYSKSLIRLKLKRGTAYAWLSEYDTAIANYKEVINSKLLEPAQKEIVAYDMGLIQKRRDSNEIKKEGDELLKKNQLKEASQKFKEALNHDPLNEYAISNLALMSIKKSKYEKCIEYSSRALHVIDSFQNDTKSFERNNHLEVKLLLRRGKSYEMLKQYENAKKDYDQCIVLEPRNTEAGNLLKRVQEHFNNILYDEYRKKGNDLLMDRKFEEALDRYDKCLKITRKATTLDNISVFVNRCACLLSIGKYDYAIVECNDALRLVKNYKNKEMSIRKQDNAQEYDRVMQMQIRLLVRKANALVKLDKLDEAQKEFEKALDLDPDNKQIKNDLEAVKKALS